MKFAANNAQDTVFRYMYAGAAFADANEYRPCIALWNYALSLKVCKETLLSCDTREAIQLTKIWLEFRLEKRLEIPF